MSQCAVGLGLIINIIQSLFFRVLLVTFLHQHCLVNA
jgi:hypothetical protein